MPHISFKKCEYVFKFFSLLHWNRIDMLMVTLHWIISASIRRCMTFDPAEVPILPGGKCCALALLNIIPMFPKEKHQFLSDLSSKSSISMCSICMITKGYKVFFRKLCQSKNVICDESPPKRWTVVETFAWRLVDGLVQDCSISSAIAMEILQSCTKPSIWSSLLCGACLTCLMSCLLMPWWPKEPGHQQAWHCMGYCATCTTRVNSLAPRVYEWNFR